METVFGVVGLVAFVVAGSMLVFAVRLHDLAAAGLERTRVLQSEMHREWGERQSRLDATLLEMQRLNQDFEEACALFEYGAVDEAVEMAGRWKERAADGGH